MQILRPSQDTPKEDWPVERDERMTYGEFLRLPPAELMCVRFVRFDDE